MNEVKDVKPPRDAGRVDPLVGPDDVIISRQVYVCCKMMVQLERLREKGLVGGGPEIDEPKMVAIIEAAEALGMKVPTDSEVKDFVTYMARGGDFAADFPASV